MPDDMHIDTHKYTHHTDIDSDGWTDHWASDGRGGTGGGGVVKKIKKINFKKANEDKGNEGRNMTAEEGEIEKVF